MSHPPVFASGSGGSNTTKIIKIVHPETFALPSSPKRGGGGGKTQKRKTKIHFPADGGGSSSSTHSRRKLSGGGAQAGSNGALLEQLRASQLHQYDALNGAVNGGVGGVGRPQAQTGGSFGDSMQYFTDLKDETKKAALMVSTSLPAEFRTSADSNPFASPFFKYRIVPKSSAASTLAAAAAADSSSQKELDDVSGSFRFDSGGVGGGGGGNQLGYGCLKYGKLWKGWKSNTQKNAQTLFNHPPHVVPPRSSSSSPPVPPASTATTASLLHDIEDMRKSELEKKMQYCHRKTSRRVYRIGKSNGKIGILISNMTIRTEVMQKMHEMRKMQINDIKKYLFHRGFIKIGSSAPDDLVRALHEACMLLCGEVDNHNPDNLLFNYLYGRKDVIMKP